MKYNFTSHSAFKQIGSLCDYLSATILILLNSEGAWTQMLNRIRVGEPTSDDIRTLESRPSTLLKKQEYKEI